MITPSDAVSFGEPRPAFEEDSQESWLATMEARRREKDQRAATRWISHMLCGDFEAAWKESDAIRARGGFDPHRFWDGELLDGKRVIMRCLHGLGDAIQFLRYAERLTSVAAELVVEVPPALLGLAPCIQGVKRVITWGDSAPPEKVNWDKQIEVMELPYYFRTTLNDLPVAEKYVSVPENVRRFAARTMGSATKPRVGVVWAAGGWNRARSVPFNELARLLAMDGCEFWNLQGGADHDAWNALVSRPALRDAAECGEGVLTLAAVIREMDLIITVDTLAAHLAGAIGQPAWVLLEYAADWRWMRGRNDSPWYPALRLFRQPAENDWQGLVSTVGNELAGYLRSWKMRASER
jgi:Glycosyltransferase family 9 (heptosyltransferase)